MEKHGIIKSRNHTCVSENNTEKLFLLVNICCFNSYDYNILGFLSKNKDNNDEYIIGHVCSFFSWEVISSEASIWNIHDK